MAPARIRAVAAGCLVHAGAPAKFASAAAPPTAGTSTPMKSHYRVVVIGGGIVGTSVLYHLAKLGWSDIALLERTELTAGSSWHAAGGFHAINDDPNIAALQAYTIRLYKDIEVESGQSTGMRMTGGYSLATTPERWLHLQAEFAKHQTLGIESRLVSAEEIVADCPIVDGKGLLGGLFDVHEGRVDPHGTTHAFAIAARARGCDVILRNRALSMSALQGGGGGWRLETEQGCVTAEHVVNAGGLWARRVGRMAGVDLPLTPMQHHYLITQDLPELLNRSTDMPSVTDLEGFTYLQQERKGVLLGVYERTPKHWKTEGADWDFGMQLFPEDIDRISPELMLGFDRFPSLQKAGIRKWVNGAFTFTPDGNPLIGPVPGLRNFWSACGCMAGFSQGGAIGKVLSNWMVHGDPDADIFGMDVARFGAYASNDRYLLGTTGQFYSRRFVISYPNEELPAARPLKMTPSFDAQQQMGARFGCVWGMESAQYYVTDTPAHAFVEAPTLKRSSADKFVASEVAATRSAAGLLDTNVYARYEVTGAGAEQWLDSLVASKLPNVGRVKLAPMLSHRGRLMGDLSITRLAKDRFWLVGSYYLQDWHQRWFRQNLPDSVAATVTITNLSETWLGFSLSGPKSRAILSGLTRSDVSHKALPFMACAHMDVGPTKAVVARLSLTGELGYEINVPASQQLALWRALQEAGAAHGMRAIGMRAQDSMRLEKGYGIWSLEFTADKTPDVCGLDKFVDFDKPAAFIGRQAALHARAAASPCEKLVLLEIDTADAEVTGYEPVFLGQERVGYVTSGCYGHWVKKSLALAYLRSDVLLQPSLSLTVPVVGQTRRARILTEPPYDPKGSLLRS